METTMNEDQDLVMDELATLKARADMLGITYHPSIGLEKLKEKLAAVQKEPEEKATEAAPMDARASLKADALRLIRVRLTCMNPAKKEWDGEFISAGNSVIGTAKRYIPFHADEGWHIEKILYDYLVDKQCQIFVTHKDGRGNNIRKGKLIKEFAIEVLPSLTNQEIKDIAQRQAMANSVD
jgi:hypothetical protein